jgi:anti-sigma B factor antagonist
MQPGMDFERLYIKDEIIAFKIIKQGLYKKSNLIYEQKRKQKLNLKCKIMKTLDREILSLKKFDNKVTVTLRHSDRLNVLNSEQVEGELLQLLHHGEKTILFDFSNMKFIDSSGFHALLSVHIDAKLKDVKFIIVNSNVEILDLFRLVDLDNIFDIRSKSEFIHEDFKKAS